MFCGINKTLNNNKMDEKRVIVLNLSLKGNLELSTEYSFHVINFLPKLNILSNYHFFVLFLVELQSKILMLYFQNIVCY